MNILKLIFIDYTKIIYLANPDNPTGTYFTKNEFDAFMEEVPDRVLVILDEAYFEYSKHLDDYPDSMHYRYDNVITLRTFSKAHGLAGFRAGSILPAMPVPAVDRIFPFLSLIHI